MLPIPFIDFIPKIFRDNIDNSMQSLCDLSDTHIQNMQEDNKILSYFLDPVKCPTKLLDYLGYYINAGIKDGDSDRTKRRKIYYAIQNHKLRATWNYDTKTRIDSITGYDARIFRASDEDDFIFCGDSMIGANNLAILGTDGLDDTVGISLIGEGTELEIAGNIFINCHYGIYTDVLTSDQIEQIKTDIEMDNIPAYYVVYLGYVNTSNQFIVYADGVM